MLTRCAPSDRGADSELAERFSFDCRATVDALGGWSIEYRVRLWRDDATSAGKPYRWIITEISLDSGGGEGDWPHDRVTRRVLDSLPLDELRDVVTRWVVEGGVPIDENADRLGPGFFAEWERERDAFKSKLTAQAAPSGRGRPRTVWPDQRLRELALRAVELGESHPKDWRKRLAGEFAESDAQHGDPVGNWISRQVSDARGHGWLAPASGRGDRSPPRRGPRLIEEQDLRTGGGLS